MTAILHDIRKSIKYPAMNCLRSGYSNIKKISDYKLMNALFYDIEYQQLDVFELTSIVAWCSNKYKNITRFKPSKNNLMNILP